MGCCLWVYIENCDSHTSSSTTTTMCDLLVILWMTFMTRGEKHQRNDALNVPLLLLNCMKNKGAAADGASFHPFLYNTHPTYVCVLLLLKSNKRWFNLNLIWTLFMMLAIMIRIKQIKIQFLHFFLSFLSRGKSDMGGVEAETKKKIKIYSRISFLLSLSPFLWLFREIL